MKPRILVVEDETHLAQGLKYNLEAEGYKVSLADTGTTALRLLENDSHAYDLLILDLMLNILLDGVATILWPRGNRLF